MSQPIHAIKVGGKTRYRIWSTIVDAYITEPMTREEARAWVLRVALAEAERQVLSSIDARLERAEAVGTSGRGPRSLDEWEVER